MATLQATSSFILDGQFTGSGALNNPTVPMVINKTQVWANGAGDNQANQFFQISTTANATTDSYDLTASLTDDFGTTLTFTTIKGLVIHNTSLTSGNQLVIAGNFIATVILGGTSPTLKLDPAGIWYITSPLAEYDVTGTSADIITVASGSNVVTYDLILIGTV